MMIHSNIESMTDEEWNQKFYNCPECHKAKKLFAMEGGKLGCPSCFTPTKNFVNVNLGQTVDKWRKPDGSLGRITEGKKSEIEWRRVTPEGEVINSKTKRPAQY